MKKVLTLLLTALLCASMVSAAMGEASLRQVYQFTADGGAEFISGSDRIEIGRSPEKAIAAMDGTLLTEPAYYSIRFEKGYFVVKSETGEEGVLNGEGQVVAPCEYDDILTLSEVWAGCVVINRNGTEEDCDYKIFTSEGTQYGLIEKVDLYNVKEGKLMATLTRDHFVRASAQGELLNVYDRETETVQQYDGNYQLLGDVKYVHQFPDEEKEPYSTYYEDGKYGLKDDQDHILIAARFDYIQDIRDGLVRVKMGDSYGMCDLDGNMLIPAEYDGFDYYTGSIPTVYTDTPFAVFGYVSVKKDDKTGYYSLTEKAITAEPRYGTADQAYNYGVSQLIRTDDAYYLYAADGTETKLEGCKYGYHLDYSLGRYYKVQDETYKYGMTDWHGREVLPCVFDEISLSGDGRYLLTYESETNTVTVYELTDEFVSGD